MADYTNIPDTNLAPGKPVRSIDGLALRDNPIAIAEGATGAPRNTDASLSTTVTTVGVAWVSNRIASAEAGGVGTYVFATSNATDSAFGITRAGSLLTPTSAVYAYYGANDVSFAVGAVLSGTWRCMGYYDASVSSGDFYMQGATLWLRIS